MASAESQIKRLYRDSVECVKYLDQTTKDGFDLTSLFSPKTLTVRHKLCEYCEKILFLKPMVYGKKSEEIIWRKCFYEPINRIRRSNYLLSSNDRCFYRMHLASASGYYASLLIKIQQEFHYSLPTGSDLDNNQLAWSTSDLDPNTELKNLHEVAFQLAHRIFIYLGDLARYQQELEESNDIRLAQHYYHLALRLKPFHGQPHNQLGTLFVDKNFGIDACLCYLRCIFSAESFMGADGNLAQLLNRNRDVYRSASEEILHTKESRHEAGDSDVEIKYCLAGYLHMLSIFYDDIDSYDSGAKLQDEAQKVLQLFSGVMNTLLEAERSFDLVFMKIIACQMIVVKKLRDKASLKFSSSVAFLISLLNIYLENVNAKLSTAFDQESASDGIMNNAVNVDSTVIIDTTGPEPNSVCTEEIVRNGKEHKARSQATYSVLRRRRQVSDDGSMRVDDISNGNHASDSADDDVVELEESDEYSDSSDVNFDLKNDDFPPLPIENGVVSVEEEKVATNDNSLTSGLEFSLADHASSKIRSDDAVKKAVSYFASNAQCLIVMKVACDWLLYNANCMIQLGEITKTCWRRLDRLLDLLPADEELLHALSLEPNLRKEWNANVSDLSHWQQRIALVEDIYLRGIPSLTQSHSDLCFDSVGKYSLEAECLIRMCCIKSIAQKLLKLHRPEAALEKKKEVNRISTSEMVEKRPNKQNDSARREQLMRSMAKLRLKDEMRTIEKVAWIPVYLVLDSNSLCYSSHSIKRLLSSRKFVLVVPNAVLDTLDASKKESVNAREAIRWLEAQFKLGKYVRAQKFDETTGTEIESKIGDSLAKYENKREISGIIDCSAYLSRTVNSTTSTVVCILTENDKSYRKTTNIDESTAAGNLISLYKQLTSIVGLKGINVESARHFSDRWSMFCNKSRGNHKHRTS